MKILLVGAGGVGVTAAKIAKNRDPEGTWLEKMVLANRTFSRAEEAAKELADSRFVAEQVNPLDKEAVKALIKKHDADILLNTCTPDMNESLFDAAYEAGINYMDTAMTLSVPHPEKPYELTNIKMGDYQFDKAKDWEAKGNLALVGMGIDPGAVNVFARYAQKHCFDEIDEISIKDGGNLESPDHDVAFGFSIWTTIDECLNPPFKYEKGKGIHVVEPFSEPELFTFPDGIGEQELVNVEHEEMVMLPRTMGDICNKMSFKYGLGSDFIQVLKNLKALGLDDKHKKVPGTDLTPRDVVGLVAPSPKEASAKMTGKCCVGTQVTGTKDGMERKVFIYQTTDNQDCVQKWGCGAVVGQTAYNPVIALELLATGKWSGKGVQCPECFNPDDYVKLADEHGYYMGIMEMDSEYKKYMDKKILLEEAK